MKLGGGGVRNAEARHRPFTSSDLEKLVSGTSFLEQHRKEGYDLEKRKHETNGRIFGHFNLDKYAKVKKVALQMTVVLLTIALLVTLSLPVVLEDRFPQQVEREFSTTKSGISRRNDRPFPRKIEFTEEVDFGDQDEFRAERTTDKKTLKSADSVHEEGSEQKSLIIAENEASTKKPELAENADLGMESALETHKEELKSAGILEDDLLSKAGADFFWKPKLTERAADLDIGEDFKAAMEIDKEDTNAAEITSEDKSDDGSLGTREDEATTRISKLSERADLVEGDIKEAVGTERKSADFTHKEGISTIFSGGGGESKLLEGTDYHGEGIMEAISAQMDNLKSAEVTRSKVIYEKGLASENDEESQKEEVESADSTPQEFIGDSKSRFDGMYNEIGNDSNYDWPQEVSLLSPLKQNNDAGVLRSGLLNMDGIDFHRWASLTGGRPILFPMKRVNESISWKDLYPEWIDEEEKFTTPACPSLPMPKVDKNVRLDVVVVRAPCNTVSSLSNAPRNPSYLQMLLGAANVAVQTGNESIYVLVLSECRPIVNLFTCGELLEHRDQGWLFKVDVEKMKKRILVPVGSCQLSAPLHELPQVSIDTNLAREAYVSILHTTPAYVCGAIAVAQSIQLSGSKKDLVILVDENILPEHRQGLTNAGWQVRTIERIRNPHSEKGAYNEWNYSKFRLWQLTEYSKIIFIDADSLVLRNLDFLFKVPEVAASGNSNYLFNSGVMVIEPSNCTFQLLMDRINDIVSNNGGDQDFLNEVFPWWHRLPRHINYLKFFWTNETKEVDYMTRLFAAEPQELYVIHYLGIKPWLCYRDYDCNWNFERQFASDDAHAQWFKVYDRMPENLQKHCWLPTVAKAYLEVNRRSAEGAGHTDRHWSIMIKDPRLTHCSEEDCNWRNMLLHWGESPNSVTQSNNTIKRPEKVKMATTERQYRSKTNTRG